MLQRLQTVYLVLAILVVIATLNLPTFTSASNILPPFKLYATGAEYGTAGMVMESSISLLPLAFPLLTIVLLVIAIGKYKTRQVQIRLISLANLTILASLTVLTYVYQTLTGFLPTVQGIGIGFFVMLIAPVCNLLAINRIRRDEKLVRSMDRLR